MVLPEHHSKDPFLISNSDFLSFVDFHAATVRAMTAGFSASQRTDAALKDLMTQERERKGDVRGDKQRGGMEAGGRGGVQGRGVSGSQD